MLSFSWPVNLAVPRGLRPQLRHGVHRNGLAVPERTDAGANAQTYADTRNRFCQRYTSIQER